MLGSRGSAASVENSNREATRRYAEPHSPADSATNVRFSCPLFRQRNDLAIVL